MNLGVPFYLEFEGMLNLFKAWMLVHAITALYEPKRPERIWGPYVIFTLLTAGAMSLSLFANFPLMTYWPLAFPLVYTLLFFKNDTREIVLWDVLYCFAVVSLMCITHVVNEIIRSSGWAGLAVPGLKRGVREILSIVILAVGLNAFSSQKRKIDLKARYLLLLAAVTGLLTGMVVLCRNLYIGAQLEAVYAAVIEIVLLAVMILCFCIFRTMARAIHTTHDEGVLAQRELHDSEKLKEMQEVYESIRMVRHDIRNQILIAREMKEQGEAGDAYLQHFEAALPDVFNTGIPALDSALYLKKMEMMQREIVFRSSIELKDAGELGVAEDELCSIVMNLLDNAMDYLKSAEAVSEKRISLGIMKQGEMLCLRCSNPLTGQLKMGADGLPETTKGDGHGLGLKIIRRIVKKHDGTLIVKAEGGEFRSEIVVPCF